MKYITHPSKIYIYITYRIVRIIDGFHDRRICGYDLTKRRVTNIEGGNHYAPTCYWTLDEMFRNTKFTEKDHIVDVGCGKGRVLVWWLGKGLPGKATGIELDPYVAGVARMWLQRYPEWSRAIANTPSSTSSVPSQRTFSSASLSGWSRNSPIPSVSTI